MPSSLRRLCVFCGSASGARPEYEALARELGTALAERGVGIVYGGASVGLMGALADAALAAGGEVIGVIPQALVDREVAHPALGDLRLVGSMHERKALMAELSDAFVAIPGGMGTLEELFEVFTWRQIGIHDKPIALLDVVDYWAGLVTFLEHAEAEGFLRAGHRESLALEADVPGLLARLDRELA
jgi:uncharacterized protein (TIGR00730 family)